MPSHILKALALQWSLFAGRYETFIATEPKDVTACIDVLEAVRRKELNRVTGSSVVESGAFGQAEVPYELVACRDTKNGKIVGCIRLTSAAAVSQIPSSREEYLLDLFQESLLNQLSIFTRLAVIKEYRKTPAALLIMAFAFKETLDRGGQGVLMSCEPNLFKMYKRLGLRPLGPLHNSPSGGYRLPMICIPDYDHFRLIRSPALSLLKTINWGSYQEIKNWYLGHIQERGEIQLGATLYDTEDLDHDDHWPITQGLEKASLDRFLQNAIQVNCQEGDLLIAKEDGGKFVGIIKEGFGKVQVEGKTIALLSRGDIFGEIAYILDQYRSANVVAGDDNTQILLFSVTKIRETATDAELVIVWRNLAKILAQRLLDSHSFILEAEQ